MESIDSVVIKQLFDINIEDTVSPLLNLSKDHISALLSIFWINNNIERE